MMMRDEAAPGACGLVPKGRQPPAEREHAPRVLRFGRHLAAQVRGVREGFQAIGPPSEATQNARMSVFHATPDGSACRIGHPFGRSASLRGRSSSSARGLTKMRACNDTNCLGDCSTCNRAPIENRPLPRQSAAMRPLGGRGCADALCRGDCTWCNRAFTENAPLAIQMSAAEALTFALCA
jgi:hypothetical protein